MSPPPSPRGGSYPSPEGGGMFPGNDSGGWPASRDDDGWGPSTAVYSSAATSNAPSPGGRASRAFHPRASKSTTDDSWAPAKPRTDSDQREARAADRRTERSVDALQHRHDTQERGLPWWAALLVLLAVAGLGGLVDAIGSIQVKGGFNVGIVVASVIAIIAVRRSHMFPIVIAPPIVYSGAALIQLYVRSSGLNDKRVVLDAAANYLVYGFPAIAAASAAVLIIAGIRLITRK